MHKDNPLIKNKGVFQRKVIKTAHSNINILQIETEELSLD